jgi:hypothetical protein
MTLKIFGKIYLLCNILFDKILINKISMAIGDVIKNVYIIFNLIKNIFLGKTNNKRAVCDR